MINCGLDALSKLNGLKNVSAFTMVHLARDNGLNLFVFKVDIKDLPRVARPAIFHQKDHFVYVKQGEAMPDGEYTGYVVGPTVLGRVISLSEAKFIKGGKNFFTGKNSDGEQTGKGAIGTILTTVAAIVGTVVTGGNPLGGAAAASAVNTAYGAVERAQNQDELGKWYDPKAGLTDAAMGAVQGYGVGSLTAGAARAAGAASGGSALQSSAYNGAFNAARAGTGTTFSAVPQAGLNLAGQVGATNAITSGANGAANLASGVSAFNNGGSSILNSTASNAASGTQGANAAFTANPNFSLTNIPFSAESAKAFNVGGGSTPNSAFSNAVAGAKQGVSDIGSGISNINSVASKATGGLIGGSSSPFNASNAATLAGAVGVFGSKPPEYSGSTPTDNYSAVSQFLGKSALGDAAAKTNLDYVNTPIEDLQKQFTGNNQRMLDSINTAYDNQKSQLVHQYAQAGQNIANSSELQEKVAQIEQKRVNDVTLANQELSNQALGQAIQVKQQALSQGMQAGQWNQSLAYQLASLTGDQQNLQYAIANNDYESFQQIMGKLMSMGIPQTVKVT